jgi:RNA polymerase sigma factor (sigma-70 family)
MTPAWLRKELESMTDAELVLFTVNDEGLTPELGEFYRRYAAGAVRHLRMKGRVNEAEDVVQEVFLRLPRIFKTSRNVHRKSNMQGWLNRVAWLHAFDFDEEKLYQAATHTEWEIFMKRAAGPAFNQEDELLIKERLSLLSDLIDRLGLKHRQILYMREVLGMESSEIARALDYSHSTAIHLAVESYYKLAELAVGTELESILTKATLVHTVPKNALPATDQIRDFMKDGRWHSSAELRDRFGYNWKTYFRRMAKKEGLVFENRPGRPGGNKFRPQHVETEYRLAHSFGLVRNVRE